MRKELAYIEEIERYLANAMSSEERAAFEAGMQKDGRIAQDVLFQQQLAERIRIQGFKADMMTLHNTLAGKPSWWKNRYFLSVFIGLLFLAGILLAVYSNADRTKSAAATSGLHSGQNSEALQNNTSLPGLTDTLRGKLQSTDHKIIPASQESREAVSHVALARKTKSPLQAVFDNFLPPFETEVFDIGTDYTFQMVDSKSFVHVPAFSMEYKSGQPVKGKVEIRYREYRDAAQMAFSRIPMKYSEAGEEFNFNSAGMFEIYAFQDGKELKIKNGKEISVAYNVTAQLDDCYFFQLVDNKWKKLSKIDFDKKQGNQAKPNEAKSSEKSGASDGTSSKKDTLTGMLIARITRAGQDELLTGAKFNFVKDKTYNEKTYKSGYHNDLHTIDNIPEGRYTIRILCKGFSSVKIEGVEIKRDMLSELNVSLKPLVKRKTWTEKLTAFFNKQEPDTLVESDYQLKSNYRTIKDYMDEITRVTRETWEKQEALRREQDSLSSGPGGFTGGGDIGHTYPNLVMGLSCPDFGVYNCDQIYRTGPTAQIYAKYLDEKGNVIHDTYLLSLVDLKVNASFSFTPSLFSCSMNGRNMLLLFTSDNKLYALREEDFKSMGIDKSGSYTFRMKDITAEIKNTEDLRLFLGLK